MYYRVCLMLKNMFCYHIATTHKRRSPLSAPGQKASLAIKTTRYGRLMQRYDFFFWFYTHSSDFLISCIFPIVVLPTLRNLINSPSGIVRNRLTSIISCPFSYRMMFASFNALFAIVRTLSSSILILFNCPLTASGIASKVI